MRLSQIIVFALIVFLLVRCDNQFNKKSSNAATLFTLVPVEQTHVDFSNKVVQDTIFNCVKYMYALNGGGVAIGDINNDGLQDIYFLRTSNLINYISIKGILNSKILRSPQMLLMNLDGQQEYQ